MSIRDRSVSTESSMLEAFLAELGCQIGELVGTGARVILAVSGGPDSLALLFGWAQLREQRNDDLHVAHFDHGWRAESHEDAQRVAKWADELGLPFHTESASSTCPKSQPSPSEAVARDARYDFLSRTAQTVGAPFVATGHTSDDQVETVLHAILRGTGIHGLAGMPRRRDLRSGVSLVRPMLGISRRQVAAFLETKELSPCDDPSNGDRRFTRNRIRAELIPLLRRDYNPRVDEAILRLAQLADRSSELIDTFAERLLEEATQSATGDEVVLEAGPLESASPSLVTEALRLLFRRMNWPRARIGFEELARIAALVHDESPGAWDLADGIRAERVAKPAPAIRLTRRPPTHP